MMLPESAVFPGVFRTVPVVSAVQILYVDRVAAHVLRRMFVIRRDSASARRTAPGNPAVIAGAPGKIARIFVQPVRCA